MPPKKGKGKKGNSAPSLAEVASAPAPIISDRTCTGSLVSRENSRDVRIENFSLSYFGRNLVTDSVLEINHGRRYGLIGQNGSGKSTFLKSIAAREVPIPSLIDIWHLSEEVEASDRTAIQAVTDLVEAEKSRLEAEEERLLEEEGPESEALMYVYDRLEALDPSTFESRAAALLHNLGFSSTMMNKMTKDMSGGWRMRVALARALFIKPTLLLLDEPTNHLDLNACVWLEEYLKTWENTLIIVSHSQDFLNGVCTNTIHLSFKKLVYYGGNYDTFMKTKEELETNQMKHFAKQQEEIADIKKFIASCGTYSNLVKQAKSRQKVLDKMEAAGLVQEVQKERTFSFYFDDPGSLPNPIVNFDEVAFSYSGEKKDYLYQHLTFGIHTDSRIALVGPNGAGKSTLLKLMVGDLTATSGRVDRNPHLVIGRYHQHSTDQLDLSMTPLDFFKREFPLLKLDDEVWRSVLGRYGVNSTMQLTPMMQMSDGQKSRLVFAIIKLKTPNLLLFDEPTNHLDMECIDALADALNEFQGGLVLVSHDFRLISQVAKEIWLCDHKTVKPFKGDIKAYKEMLKKEMKTSLGN